MCFSSKIMETEIPNHESLKEPLSANDKFFPKNKIQLSGAWCRWWFENFEGYADRYASSAEQLCMLSKGSSEDKDSLAYPIMFLSRHAIELRLKSILWALQRSKGASHIDNRDLQTHSLVQLWQKIDAVYEGEKTDVYKYASQRLSELNIFDVNSDTFRYPIHTDGTPTRKTEFIDIDAFMKTFRKLNNFLEGLESEIQEQLDNQLDNSQHI